MAIWALRNWIANDSTCSARRVQLVCTAEMCCSGKKQKITDSWSFSAVLRSADDSPINNWLFFDGQVLLFVFRTDCWMQRWQSTVCYPLFEPWIQTGFSSADRNALLACAEDLSLSLYQQEHSCSLKPTTNTWQVCCTAEYLLCKSLCSGLLHHTLWLILEGCSDAVLSFLGYSFTSFSFDLAFIEQKTLKNV